ncbi:PTS sugar transporter subunit IIA [Trichloromonas sp.]|uniref:PTS sugar transporter subunit IIA n=1 Tax=Trichloromonas sp. TaxID=3069249 RepID=UPI002A3D66BD|nr:hypothetical protein [Trichloromonas sp.]
MIGLVIATHAHLGEEFLRAAEMIVGPTEQARAVSIDMGDSVDSIRERIATAIGEVGSDGEGVVILTDMFGGTPSNISLAFLEQQRVEVVTGVNLPMVLKFFNSGEGLALEELAALLKACGEQGIFLPSELLKK